MSLMSFLSGLGPWSWLILALILYGLEAVVPGVNMVWFGTAALAVGAIVFATDISWPWQLIIFAAFSIATAFAVRKYARAHVNITDVPDLNVRSHQYVGREFVVAEAIKGGRGRVRVGDTLWQAEGEDTPAGTRVRVKDVHDAVLMVERVSA